MPEYSFFMEGGSAPLTEIRNLPNVDAAKSETVIYAGRMLQKIDGAFWEDGHRSVEVADATGLILCSISIKGFNAPNLAD